MGDGGEVALLRARLVQPNVVEAVHIHAHSHVKRSDWTPPCFVDSAPSPSSTICDRTLRRGEPLLTTQPSRRVQRT
jgi:hypothetical protein